MARAMYSDRDIYLMDDPLSAVDVHVGKQLFERCLVHLVGERHKTVVFITHQIQVRHHHHDDDVMMMRRQRRRKRRKRRMVV